MYLFAIVFMVFALMTALSFVGYYGYLEMPAQLSGTVYVVTTLLAFWLLIWFVTG